MDLFLDLFTKKEIMIIACVIGTLLLMVLILTIVDYLSKKKEESIELNEAFKNIDDDKEIKKIEINELNEINKEEVKLLSIEQEPSKELEIESLEIDNIKEPIKEVIQEEEKINYIEPIIIDDEVFVEESDSQKKAKDELLKIEEELENPKSLEDTLYNLEIMEEENAIISYQELLENTKELEVVSTDSGDEIISLKEILNIYNDPQVDVSSEMSKTTINEAYKGDFTSSPYLSPIRGFEYEKASLAKDLSEIQLENTANLEKLDKEIRKTNEFLSILNDLKKNLE